MFLNFDGHQSSPISPQHSASLCRTERARGFLLLCEVTVLLSICLGSPPAEAQPGLDNDTTTASKPHPLCPLPSYEGVSRPTGPNILLLAVDTLRRDRLGLYGHPRPTSAHLDALAEESWVYDHAIAAAPWTTPSFAGMLTGHHPGALGMGYDPESLPAEIPTLAEELSGRGYATAGVVSHFFIGTKFHFNRGFDFWDQRAAGGHAQISSDIVSNLSLHCLDALASTERPFFLWAHYFDPHYDYLNHPEFSFSDGYKGSVRSRNDNFEDLRGLAKQGKMTDADRQYLLDLYDSEIAFTDSHIGRVLNRLKEKGLYDDTLVVVLADHGEMFGFRNGRWIGHTQYLWDELIRVPLIVKLPSSSFLPKRKGRIATPVSLVDLKSSLLALIDPDISPTRTWIPDADGRVRAAPVFSQTRRWRELDAMIDGHWKMVLDQKTERVLLYDLKQDPGELQNVAGQHTERVAEMKEQLLLWNKSLQLSASKLTGRLAPRLTDEEVETMRSLGYIQ